jgi:octaheme c-type cytochrome (tetrathionate reductase family)
MKNNRLPQSTPIFPRAASVILAAVFALGALLVPGLGLADTKAAPALQKSDLLTPGDYMEYASINDENIHELFFSAILYEGTETCLLCHQDQGEQLLDTGHFKQSGVVENIVGLEGKEYGKKDLLNNFCVAVPSNEGRCSQCHIGYGWKDKNYDFNDPTNVDCLVCHDQSGEYQKGKTSAGLPEPDVDLNVVARSIAVSGRPNREACLDCHAYAGGGDNVKHGDLSSNQIETTREYDVHMGVDGANFDCVNCHGTNHDPKTGDVNHGNAGMSLHSVHEGEMKQCVDCHGSRETIHAGTMAEANLFAEDWHDRLACQVCHIPAIARKLPTKVEWYWEDAGKESGTPDDPVTGKPTWDRKKGTFVWKTDVRPALRYANGKWERKVIGVSDKYDEEPIQLAVPQGDYYDPTAMIYPFKLMKGNQPVDPNTRTVLVPHLFGKAGGPNPFWEKWDWTAALQDGADYTGQDFSGTHIFGMTEMLLSVNHEVAPAEDALGYGPIPEACVDCHTTGVVDFTELGWTADPLNGGEREEAGTAVTPPARTGLD